ncbi:MAG: hypothetical protein DRO67_02005 [Candidatus Asgardarchaeum californiense]|nr:MAG: hypothetical protein DRO67_02005 [Candidatus Asgardarchaeum californiense]
MKSTKTNNTLLIGLVGPAGVGKTTIAKVFEAALGFKIMSFAEPLKKSLSVLTGLPPKYFTNIELKEKQIPGLDDSPRTLMQKFGTEFVRDTIHKDFWVWRMRNNINKYPNKNIIIDDIRFHNEAQLVRDMGGVVIHLNREYDSPTKHTNHISEKPVSRMDDDFIVHGTHIRDTYNKCIQCLKKFYKVYDI